MFNVKLCICNVCRVFIICQQTLLRVTHFHSSTENLTHFYLGSLILLFCLGGAAVRRRTRRVGFLPAETCFCRTCGLNQFKPD